MSGVVNGLNQSTKEWLERVSIKKLIQPRQHLYFIDHLVLLILCTTFYLRLIQGEFGFWTDITTHNQFAAEWWYDIHVPPHYRVYYIFVIIFTGFHPTPERLGASSAVVISLFLMFRYVITMNIFLMILKVDSDSSKKSMYLLSGLIAASTIIAMPLPWGSATGSVYMGSLLSNGYHSATQIVSTPFAIITFILYMSFLVTKRDDLVWQIVASSLICAYAKPSFVTIFLPLCAVHAGLSMMKSDGRRNSHLLLIGSSLLPLIAMYILTFGDGNPGSGGVSFGWFEVQRARSWPYPALLIHMSFWFFPLYLASRDDPQTMHISLNAILLAFFAIAQASFIHENGPRFLNLNFGWSAQAAWACLLIVGWSVVLRGSSERDVSAYRFVFVVMLLFIVSGLYNVYYILTTTTHSL